jgi:CheY-like chemotaxis protein
MNKYRILIVEDDELSQKAWQTIFATRGWDVTFATTVADGLALLDPAPDFLILDLSLPDGDGETILRKIRDENLKTRVTVTTGDSDTARLRAVRKLNPEALFTKPIDVVDVWRQGELARAV